MNVIREKKRPAAVGRHPLTRKVSGEQIAVQRESEACGDEFGGRGCIRVLSAAEAGQA